MLSFLRTAALVFLFVAGAAALGVLLSERGAGETAQERFEQSIESLRNAFLSSDVFRLPQSISIAAVSLGGDIVVFGDAGSHYTTSDSLNPYLTTFSSAVASISHRDVLLDFQGRVRRFRSIPVSSHLFVKHLFFEIPAPLKTSQVSATRWALLLLASALASFLLAALLYWLHASPVLILSKALESAVSARKSQLPFANSREPIGELSRKIRESLELLWSAQEKIIASERLAVFKQVTAGIAHEVRNPLTAISMTAQMLSKKVDDPMSQERLRVIIAEIDRLKHHMDQLINFGRPFEPSLRQTDITGVIRDTLLLLSRQLEHSKITVMTSFEDGLPLMFVDPDSFKQVLINIVLNAVQAMPTGGLLTVSASLTKVAGEQAMTVAISDTGSGIPPDIAHRIFEPFFSTKKAGTGLGLAIAQKIVEAHNGRVRFVSSSGGTVFRIFIPVSHGSARLREISTDTFKSLEEMDAQNPRS